MLKLIPLVFIAMLWMNLSVEAADNKDDEQMYKERMALFQKMEAVTNIPWYYFAGIDQYERNLRFVRKDLPEPDTISIYIPEYKWAGPLNPNAEDSNPASISLFQGLGTDGNADGKANRLDGEDVLAAVGRYLSMYGTTHDDIKIALWRYYGRDKAVSLIIGNANMYKTFGKLDLQEKAFPLPVGTHYTYKNTWGAARGWGGRRIHEGTDLFADYGLPVRSTSYGVVEMKGWNRYGGWRVGIRDINNTYHYYAHLSGFADGLEIGQIVKPGTVIGGVGSTGYGPPGTSGKFPPHLHYGMYKDNGRTEWSFDPYPHLRQWERNERNKKN
ncbi:Cell wall endopeptidase, family M23/M37 [Bacillus thermotolerans]|uniref:Cell wall endopeptidase, family M23/M37 n=2 Tax=Bacillus thermotolerans TaxID=1221996 RepID=A0A0F5I8B0_BACTR|nr:Cell wall endopeptidase, family M23/M37 [Bacillus thermotolerans]